MGFDRGSYVWSPALESAPAELCKIMQARPLDSAVCQTGGYLPIFRPRLASTYDITMISATKRARPSSAGNSGIPEEVPEAVDEVDDAAVV